MPPTDIASKQTSNNKRTVMRQKRVYRRALSSRVDSILDYDLGLELGFVRIVLDLLFYSAHLLSTNLPSSNPSPTRTNANRNIGTMVTSITAY